MTNQQPEVTIVDLSISTAPSTQELKVTVNLGGHSYQVDSEGFFTLVEGIEYGVTAYKEGRTYSDTLDESQEYPEQFLMGIKLGFGNR